MKNKTIKEGKHYTHRNYGGIYIVVECGKDQYRMIDINTGKRWGGSINVSEWDQVLVKIESSPIG